VGRGVSGHLSQIDETDELLTPLGWWPLQRLRQAFGEEAGESRGIAQFSAFG